jgi:hypothetical protein
LRQQLQDTTLQQQDSGDVKRLNDECSNLLTINQKLDAENQELLGKLQQVRSELSQAQAISNPLDHPALKDKPDKEKAKILGVDGSSISHAKKVFNTITKLESGVVTLPDSGSTTTQK